MLPLFDFGSSVTALPCCNPVLAAGTLPGKTFPKQAANGAQKLSAALALCGFAMILLTASARATITLHDAPVGKTNTLASTGINMPFTVTSGANVLVVVLLDKGTTGTPSGVAPSTLSWNGLTLNRAVTTVDTGLIYRDASVYYVFNPPAASANITGTLTATPTVTYLEAYTLNGVDTNAAPVTGAANSTSGTNLMFNVAVPANSWAVVGGVLGSRNVANVAVAGTGGTANVFYGNDTSTDNCAFAFGYISGLSAGWDTIQYSWSLTNLTPTANAFVAAVFAPPPSPQIAGVSLNGTTLSISATNGLAGGSWTILQSPDITLPLNQWPTICAGHFDSDGNMSLNIINAANNRQEFYALKSLPAIDTNNPGIYVDDFTGANLWMYYRTVSDQSLLDAYRSQISQVIVESPSAVAQSTRSELVTGLSDLLAQTIPATNAVTADGTIVAGTPATSPIISSLGWGAELSALAADGFILRSTTISGKDVTVIASNTERGALYGTFSFLRLLQRQQDITGLNVVDAPVNKLRMYQDWDNWDGSIERGYAGNSILQVSQLPATVSPRITTHARAMAALGLNALLLNNVNAQSNWIMSANLPKIQALANVYRNYGIQIFLTVRFDSPIVIGGLTTADPLNAGVINWWSNQVNQIYSAIPDLGGFVVKADSEGQPGPSQYGRTPAQGANLLATALQPHGGIVLWRAFVYNTSIDPDRAKTAYEFFKPWDGQFATNVILQVKNGPWDFQNREPNHPLIGGMPDTQVGIELEITQEYTGQATHLVWLVPQWKNYLDFNTAVSSTQPCTVKDVIAGTTFGGALSEFAGVSNMGQDPNWTAQTMGQANQYGFGRLAWNPSLSAGTIADEWVRITYGNDPSVVSTISSILMGSWTNYENYCLVGGPAEVTSPANHFAPDFTDNNAHINADAQGVGYDRTRETGSDYVDQYAASVANTYNNLSTCPPELLLWFHHVAYTNLVFPGKTVIQWIYDTHFAGEAAMTNTIAQWQTLSGKMSSARYNDVLTALNVQAAQADIWRRAGNSFFWNWSQITDDQGRDVATP